MVNDDRRYMKAAQVYGAALTCTGAVFVYIGSEAWRLMPGYDFLIWIVVSPVFSGTAVFAYSALSSRARPREPAWPKGLAYVFILAPAALLLSAAVIGPLRGTFDGVRWLFPTAGVWAGSWVYRLYAMTRSQFL